MELERVVISAANAAVVVSGVDVSVRLALAGIAGPGSERHIVVATHVQTPAAGTDIVNVDGGRTVNLLGDAEIPLHRVGIPGVRVHIPLHLLKGCGRGEGAATSGERALAFDVRGGLAGHGNVEVIRNLLADVGPCAFVVLRGLCDRSPVIVVDSEAGADSDGGRDAVGETDARPPVRRGVVIDLAVRRDDHVSGQSTISRDAGRMAAGGAGRRQFLYDIGSVVEV